MLLIAESGSTKTHWCLLRNVIKKHHFYSEDALKKTLLNIKVIIGQGYLNSKREKKRFRERG